jgi:Asp-tRNA(Asn)/Glu-tRNA(Gln) amidotransferase A subunit family amidase
MTAIPQHFAATGAAIRAGELSVVELTKAMLARISALDPKLKSFLTVTADQALKQAAAAEAELARPSPTIWARLRVSMD